MTDRWLLIIVHTLLAIYDPYFEETPPGRRKHSVLLALLISRSLKMPHNKTSAEKEMAGLGNVSFVMLSKACMWDMWDVLAHAAA